VLISSCNAFLTQTQIPDNWDDLSLAERRDFFKSLSVSQRREIINQRTIPWCGIGFGQVSSARVLRGTGAIIGVATLLYYGLPFITPSAPVPESISPEFKKLVEERMREDGANPISRHKIGQPVTLPNIELPNFDVDSAEE
jgi:hypothetical protein